jgi:hypothetical protein
MSNEKIILSIRRPEIREHFYFKLTLTTFNISINHTQKELERAIEVLKSHDLLEFNRTIEKVKNKEQLKDVLRASFDIWSGDKLEWLQYTKKKVKRPFGNSLIEDAGYKNLWNDWFKEMEILHNKENEAPPPKTLKEFIVAEYALTYIFDLFSNGQQIPTNRTEGGLDKKQIESQSSYYNCPKKPDTFYREVKRIIKYDINKNTYLQSISKDWRFAVLTLTKERNRLEQYLKDKELI